MGTVRSLVVEDDAVSQRLLVAFLRDYGPCDVAVNGLEALAAVEQALANNEPYHLMCLDLMMPEMDGHEALPRIRELERDAGVSKKARAKIIMVTAILDDKSVLRGIRDWDAYIVKPVEKKDFIAEVRRLGLL